MDAFVKLLEAIATLIWPGIVIAVIVIFKPAVAGIIESAKSRKFTIKVGGQELTMDEVSEQQRNLIADLQTQLVELRKHLEGTPARIPDTREPPPEQVTSVLWVDDNPKNNSYLVEQLINLGIKVDIALSTSEGMSQFARRKYSYILSDMGRNEDGRRNPDAGIDLLKLVRERDPSVPFIIFCSAQGARGYRSEAMGLGATGITSSFTELAELIHLDELKANA